MYQYLHTNGKIINKVDYPVNSMGVYEYFDSPFVIGWWHVNDETGEIDMGKSDYLFAKRFQEEQEKKK